MIHSCCCYCESRKSSKVDVHVLVDKQSRESASTTRLVGQQMKTDYRASSLTSNSAALGRRASSSLTISSISASKRSAVGCSDDTAPGPGPADAAATV